MKKFWWIGVLLILGSCVSVKQHNRQIQTKIDAKKLRKDVDFAYQKLQKLHPELYWYITKNELDHKFDSLKSTIQKPLTPIEFYPKLAPVIADVRQGHLKLRMPAKRYSKKEIKNIKKQKGLLGRMEYLVKDGRLYVSENKDDFEGIKVGSEILKIAGQPTETYLNRYQKLINSDGFNTTFQDYYMARFWTGAFTVENGILDSLQLETKFNDTINTLYIHRESIAKAEKKQEKKEAKELQDKEENKNKDYDVVAKSFNRDLQFLDKDSSIAYIKIKSFSGFRSKKFYKESFDSIKIRKVNYLILDVRDNFGGSLSEINNLYSYLAKDDFTFIKKVEVARKNSMLKANYFNEVPLLAKPFAAIFYPIYFFNYAFSAKEKEGKFYLQNKRLYKNSQPKENAFHGKVYVLINGGSFSAASILPSKLKGDERAILVGEETGGANDGTVAGQYSTFKLPHSKLELPIGLMLIRPEIELTHTKKGVTPHIEILPTAEQILQKEDIQLDWILKDIKKEKLRN